MKSVEVPAQCAEDVASMNRENRRKWMRVYIHERKLGKNAESAAIVAFKASKWKGR